MYTKIYWLNLANGPEQNLGIMARPRGHDWLEDEIRWLKTRHVNCLISLLERSEAWELGLSEEAEQCSKYDIEFTNYPIKDVDVPEEANSFLALTKQLKIQLLNHKKVVIHCRMGIGRSSMLAAAILMSLGMEPLSIFTKISTIRGVKVPDTQAQIDWINRLWHTT